MDHGLAPGNILQKYSSASWEVGQICIKYNRASVLTGDWNGSRKSLAFHGLGRFGNKILNYIDHSLIASLQTTAELAHFLVGCMNIPFAL